MFQWYEPIIKQNSNCSAILSCNIARTLKPHTEVSNCWTGIRTGSVEWTMELLCTVDGTIAHCVLAVFTLFPCQTSEEFPLLQERLLVMHSMMHAGDF